MIVVLAIEEVLSEVGVPLHEAGPTLFGRRIYRTLSASGESIVLVSTDHRRKMVQEWLLREGFDTYVRLITPDGPLADQSAWKSTTLQGLVAAGHHVAYLIDKDFPVLEEAMGLGIPVLLALHALGTPGRLSSDNSYQSWEDVVGSIEAESLRRAQERRQRRESQE